MWYVIYDGGKVPFANRTGAELYVNLLRSQGKDAYAMLLEKGNSGAGPQPATQSVSP